MEFALDTSIWQGLVDLERYINIGEKEVRCGFVQRIIETGFLASRKY